MQNGNKKTIDVLNELVEINNDRIAGYETATKETDDPGLKTLFSKLSETSKKCREELVSEVKKLGGTSKEGTATSGKIFRVWMDVKAALTKKDRKAILSSCETGEDVAVKAYEDALNKKEEIGPWHRELLVKQRDLIKTEHDKIKGLRDSTVKA